MLNLNKKIAGILLFVIAFSGLAGFILAVETDTNFPNFGGEDITEKSKLPDVVRYLLTAFVVIAVLATVGNLIYGGFEYLSSGGDTGKMSNARKRITGSFLGLIILFASYLILRTLNPTINVITINRQPIFGGVLLLDEKAIEKLGNQELDADTLQKFLESEPSNSNEPHVKYLSSSVSNVNWYWNDQFYPAGVYFFDRANARITTYMGGEQFDEIIYPQCLLKVCKFNKPINVAGTGKKMDNVAAGRIVLESALPGILISAVQPSGKIELSAEYHSNSEVVYDLPGWMLSPTRLELNNWEYRKDEENPDSAFMQADKIKNYLLVLNGGKYNTGQLRIFFEKFKPIATDSSNPLPNDVDFSYGNIKGNSGISTGRISPVLFKVAFTGSGDIVAKAIYDDFITPRRVAFRDVVDAYGSVGDVNSAVIMNMPDNPLDPNIKCGVRVCNGPPDDSNTYCANYDKPIFQPQNLEDTLNDKATYLTVGKNCAVVLFENKVPDRLECAKNPVADKCWDGGSSGSHSQTFVFPLTTALTTIDLTKEPIGACKPWYGLRIFGGEPCASAIAIYPLK